MNRPLIILVGALALAAAIFCGSYAAARHATVACCTKPDNLDWLRSEFHLSNAEMSRIRALHEGYLPKCGELCAKIAAKKTELETALNQGGTDLTEAAQARMNELAALRAQCQSQMLQHFVLVSQAMPPEQGERYLAEMKRITLGNHEEFEQSMSGATVHEHHHH